MPCISIKFLEPSVVGTLEFREIIVVSVKGREGTSSQCRIIKAEQH